MLETNYYDDDDDDLFIGIVNLFIWIRQRNSNEKLKCLKNILSSMRWFFFIYFYFL